MSLGLALIEDWQPWMMSRFFFAVGFAEPDTAVSMVMLLVTAVAPVGWTSTTTGIIFGFIFNFAYTRHTSIVVKQVSP